MAFASRDLCCSVPKVSSDQLCHLASADSEGERGRAGVASVSERARASEGVCYFNRREGVWIDKKSDFPRREVFVLRCSVDGAPPQGRMQIFSDLPPREDPVLVTTPDHATHHTKCQMSVHFFGASPSDP